MQIRPIHTRDSAAFLGLVENNRTHLSLYFPKTVDAVRDLVSAEEYILLRMIQAEKKQAFLFVIEEEEALIGIVCLKEIEWSVPKSEIAYFVAENLQGQGIITRALQFLIDFSFEELKLEKIYARISPTNPASRRVVEKNGFVFEGLFKKDFRNGDGNLMDVEYLALLRTDSKI